jgi:hypothetical protein
MADENLTAGIKRASASFVTIERPTILPRRRPPAPADLRPAIGEKVVAFVIDGRQVKQTRT